MPAGIAMIGKGLVASSLVGLAGWLALARDAGGPPAEDSPAAYRDEPAGLLIPVAGVARGQLVDTFADARAEGRRHDAIDIMAPLGTPVRAAAPGRVEKLFFSRAGGHTVYVRAPDGRRIYYYAHLDRYAPGLREAADVDRGDPIGAVGYSGNADPVAPHLHFAVIQTDPGRKWWEQGTAIDPYPLLMAGP